MLDGILTIVLGCTLLLVGCDSSSSGENVDDGGIDDGSPCPQVLVYGDTDADGHGDADIALKICENDSPPAGYVTNQTDCNDDDPRIYPGADGEFDCFSEIIVSTAVELQDALDSAEPGTTIHLASGIYSGEFDVRVSGHAGMPITLKGPPDRSAVLDGQYGITSWQGVLTIESKHHLVVENIEIRNTAAERYGVLIGASNKMDDGCHDIVLRNMHVHDVGEEIIKIQGKNSRDILVENCIVHTNQDWSAIDVQGHWGGTPPYDEKPRRVVIRNNLIYDSVAFAGVGNEFADNIHVYNNVVLGCRMGLDIGCGNYNIISNNLITSYAHFNRLKEDGSYSALDLSRFPKFSQAQIDSLRTPDAMDGIALSGNYMTLVFDNEIVDCRGKGDLILSYNHRLSDGGDHNSRHGHKGNLFFRNRIHDNDAYYTIREYDKQAGGVSHDEMFFNNLFYNNNASRDIIFEHSQGLLFYNNTIVDGDNLNLREASIDALVKNNIFINSGYDLSDDITDADIDSNHNGTETDIFAGYADNDYHLAATYGPTVIDAGVDLFDTLRPLFAAYDQLYANQYAYYDDFSITFDFFNDMDGATHDAHWDMGAFAAPK